MTDRDQEEQGPALEVQPGREAFIARLNQALRGGKPVIVGLEDTRIMMNMEELIQKRLNELAVEAHKLEAEHDKLRRDRFLAPWIIAASLVSGLIGGLISHLWK